MNGGYRFKKHKDGALKAIPEKFDAEGWSHIMDALQYVCLVVHGGLVNSYAQRLIPRYKQATPIRITAAAWT
jgi:hypothetical protein